jgi:hypothetical protein
VVVVNDLQPASRDAKPVALSDAEFSAKVEAEVNRRTAARFREDAIKSLPKQAAEFADAEVASRRSTPAEREHLIAQFHLATLADLAALEKGADTKVKLSVRNADGSIKEGEVGSYVEALKAREAARPAHDLTSEWAKVEDLKTANLSVLGGQGKDPYAAEYETTRRWAEKQNGAAK